MIRGLLGEGEDAIAVVGLTNSDIARLLAGAAREIDISELVAHTDTPDTPPHKIILFHATDDDAIVARLRNALGKIWTNAAEHGNIQCACGHPECQEALKEVIKETISQAGVPDAAPAGE